MQGFLLGIWCGLKPWTASPTLVADFVSRAMLQHNLQFWALRQLSNFFIVLQANTMSWVGQFPHNWRKFDKTQAKINWVRENESGNKGPWEEVRLRENKKVADLWGGAEPNFDVSRKCQIAQTGEGSQGNAAMTAEHISMGQFRKHSDKA